MFGKLLVLPSSEPLSPGGLHPVPSGAAGAPARGQARRVSKEKGQDVC